MRLEPYDDDGTRAVLEARMRLSAWRAARRALVDLKGSLVWVTSKGADYLVRAAYAEPGGRRRQTSLGRRSPATEARKAAYDAERAAAREAVAAAERLVERSTAVCRALRVGTLAPTAAKVLRGLDAQGLFDAGWRVGGATAALAWAATAGGRLVAESAAEAAFLGEAETTLTLTSPEVQPPRRLLDRLVRIDRGFRRGRDGVPTTADGFRVEVIGPAAAGPIDPGRARASDLAWARRGPAVEAVAIDRRGAAAACVSVDPRVSAAADLWLAGQLFRDPAARRRDRVMADAAMLVAAIVSPTSAASRGVPREVIAAVGSTWLR